MKLFFPLFMFVCEYVVGLFLHMHTFTQIIILLPFNVRLHELWCGTTIARNTSWSETTTFTVAFTIIVAVLKLTNRNTQLRSGIHVEFTIKKLTR